MSLNHVDHVAQAAGTLDLEPQPGAQANHFQQVCGNTAKITLGIKKAQRRQRFVNHDLDHGMFSQPALFTFGQLELLVSQQYVAASAPAFGDVLALVVGDGLKRGIEDVQQDVVITTNSKAEAIGFMLAEIGHFNVLQIALVDHVMRGERIAQKHIGLIKCHRVYCILVRRV